MCGIAGYVGAKNASEVIIEELKRMEYRGYDSAGITVAHKDELFTLKTVGKQIKLALRNWAHKMGNPRKTLSC